MDVIRQKRKFKKGDMFVLKPKESSYIDILLTANMAFDIIQCRKLAGSIGLAEWLIDTGRATEVKYSRVSEFIIDHNIAAKSLNTKER